MFISLFSLNSNCNVYLTIFLNTEHWILRHFIHPIPGNMPTSNMILSPQHSLTWDCCCTEDAEVTTDNDANDNGDEFDYNYQAPENGKPELGV